MTWLQLDSGLGSRSLPNLITHDNDDDDDHDDHDDGNDDDHDDHKGDHDDHDGAGVSFQFSSSSS